MAEILFFTPCEIVVHNVALYFCSISSRDVLFGLAVRRLWVWFKDVQSETEKWSLSPVYFSQSVAFSILFPLYSLFVILCNYPLFQSFCCLTGDRFLRREAKSFLLILAIKPPDRLKQYTKLLMHKLLMHKLLNAQTLLNTPILNHWEYTNYIEFTASQIQFALVKISNFKG